MRNNKVVRLNNKNRVMRDKIRQWIVDNPRAMDVAYALALSGAIIVRTQESAGATSGP